MAHLCACSRFEFRQTGIPAQTFHTTLSYMLATQKAARASCFAFFQKREDLRALGVLSEDSLRALDVGLAVI